MEKDQLEFLIAFAKECETKADNDTITYQTALYRLVGFIDGFKDKPFGG